MTVTQTLTNNTANAITTSFVATLPVGLRAAYCANMIGSCLVGAVAGRMVTPQSASQSEHRLISWTGSLPGNGTVTITYQVHVDLQATQAIISSPRVFRLEDGRSLRHHLGTNLLEELLGRADAIHLAQFAPLVLDPNPTLVTSCGDDLHHLEVCLQR